MVSTPPPTLVWLRQDLRLADNPALRAAAESGAPVVPVFVLDDEDRQPWQPGAASRWWLHHSLAALSRAFEGLGSRLVLRRGPAEAAIDRLIAETGAARVIWNRCYEPFAVARDTRIKANLPDHGVEADSRNASLLFEPWTVLTNAGEPYRVYTPFWKACAARAGEIAAPLPAPSSLPAPERWPDSDRLEDWALLPTEPDWAGGLRETWRPGEAGAQARLEGFIDRKLADYRDRRNRPDIDGTSSLSPHLHWGEIGPRQIWTAVQARRDAGDLKGRDKQAESFLQELVWREFSYNLLYHYPHLPDRPLNERYADFPYRDPDEALLEAWRRGRTGYPIVDAGMRQLWQVGWMHNRLRMIVASFLIKDLLLPWWHGEAWFWDTLVDADLANNSASWQWVAGCGADAAPYFRIFNPVLQGEKFDPQGDYVRRWVPELTRLDNRHIHKPWEAPAEALDRAGVRLGETYPHRLVDHHEARQHALAAFETVKEPSDAGGARKRRVAGGRR
jgi:deoxyribodipyrimidine photo-lyase